MKINPTNKSRGELTAEEFLRAAEVISMYPEYTRPVPENAHTPLIKSAKEHVRALRTGSRKYGQPRNEIRMPQDWLANYVERNMKS